MVVKIIKAEPSAWYQNEIGSLCDVEILDDTYFIVNGSDFNTILISDCEVIIDKNTRWILV